MRKSAADLADEARAEIENLDVDAVEQELAEGGVGKTFLVTALGHAGVRRRYSVHFERCDRMLRRLRASRLDNSHDAEVRKLLGSRC